MNQKDQQRVAISKRIQQKLDVQNEDYKNSIQKLEKMAITAMSDMNSSEDRLTPHKLPRQKKNGAITAKYQRKLIL